MGAKLVGKRFSLVLYDIRLSNFLNFAVIRPHGSDKGFSNRLDSFGSCWRDRWQRGRWVTQGELRLGPGNIVAGGIGGVIGAKIVRLLIPALRGLDVGPIVGQVIGAEFDHNESAIRVRRSVPWDTSRCEPDHLTERNLSPIP